MLEADLERLRNMKDRIERIEELALDLKSLGEGVPAVEKNAGTIIDAAYVLKCGISDIVDIQDSQGGRE